MTELDDALELKAVSSLCKADDVTELGEELELKEVLSSIEGCKLVGSDDSFESKDVVTSLGACKMTDGEALEFKEVEILLKVRELAELDDTNTVLDIFTAVADAATEFILEPNAI